MKHKVRITALPKAQQGLYTKAKLTNNAFQFPVNFKEGMKPGFDVKKNLGPTERDKANIEAEKGETIITPMGDDAWTKTIPKTYVIGGKKHYKGGTPLSVPEGSFIYSDHLKEKNPEVHKLFNRPVKKSGYTYADLSKPFMVNDDIRRLLDNDSDKITKDTARLNIMNKVDKLGLISLLQESQKGFTDDEGEIDIPTVGVPYLEKTGINLEEAVQPFLDAIKQPVPQQPQQQMMGQPGMSPEMMPDMMMPPQMMQQQPMQPEMPMKLGGLVRMKKGGAVKQKNKKYQYGGGVIGEDERVRYDAARDVYEVVNSAGQVVGIMNVSGKTVKIKKSEVPADAVIVKRTDYDSDTEFEKAKKTAYDNAGGKPVVVENNGVYKLLSQKTSDPVFTGSQEDLNTLFAGNAKIAGQYEYIQSKFSDKGVKEELAKRAITALKNPANRGKSITTTEVDNLVAKLEGPDGPELAYKMFTDMQKRNLATVANAQAGNIKSIADHQDAADAGKSSNADFEASWSKIGILPPTDEEAKLQQALYIGYKDLITDYKAGKITDDNLKAQISDFDIAQLGARDAADISGTGAGKVSIIDGDYTNTTTGQVAAVGDVKSLEESDLPETEETSTTPPEYAKQPPVGGWTAPDIMNYFGAVNEIYADQPQTPFIAQPSVYLPGVAIGSPEDAQRQIRGVLGQQAETIQAYAPTQTAISALSGLTGADQVTAQTALTHNNNIAIINQAEQNKAATLNQAALNSANLATTLRDRWALLKDNLQARKSAAKAEARKAFGIGESNEGAFQAMNLQTPNYQWDPFTQDFAGFTPSGLIEPTTESSKTSADLFAEYKNRFPGASDTALTQLVKADMGIAETPADYWSAIAANREGLE